jgi:hypothetical protein
MGNSWNAVVDDDQRPLLLKHAEKTRTETARISRLTPSALSTNLHVLRDADLLKEHKTGQDRPGPFLSGRRGESVRNEAALRCILG